MLLKRRQAKSMRKGKVDENDEDYQDSLPLDEHRRTASKILTGYVFAKATSG
jgi:hypothetical protein